MLDKNGRTIQTGDIVRIENGYFKNSNGLFYVQRGTEAPGNRYNDIWLHKISKKGEISIGSGATQSWPLKSYCTKASKNREAKMHNEQYATIEIVDNVPKYAVADFFKNRADELEHQSADMERRGWGDTEQARKNAEFCRTVAERCGDETTAPKKAEPETGIKFYYNGIKVDGDKKLVGVYYYIDEDKDGTVKGVSISAKDYKSLPKQYFDVTNDSDIMTDYFCNDRTYLSTWHPLFKYAYHSALKGIMWGKTYHKPTEKQCEVWATLEDPGQPTKADYEAIQAYRDKAVQRKREAEEAERKVEAERVKKETEQGREFIEQLKEQYPIEKGHPIVTVNWSEDPVFYSYKDDELKLSVNAMEKLLKHYDTKAHVPMGYYKTKFTIKFTRTGDTEQKYYDYEGRYDIGDCENGLINHIRNFAMFQYNNEENRKQINEFADYLETFTTPRISEIQIAPYIKKYLEQRENREE